IVTPNPARTYMTARIARSLQSTIRFHSRAIAATKARNGTMAPKRFEILCARVMAWMVPVKPEPNLWYPRRSHGWVCSLMTNACRRPALRGDPGRGRRRPAPRPARPRRRDDPRDRGRGARLRAGDGGRVRPRRAARRGERARALRRPDRGPHGRRRPRPRDVREPGPRRDARRPQPRRAARRLPARLPARLAPLRRGRRRRRPRP